MNSTNSANWLYIRAAFLTFWTLLAGLLLYNSAVISLIVAVLHREGSSHGVFVPFLSGFFLWMKRGAIREIELRYDYLGIPLVGVGVFFPLFNIGTYQLQFLSFIVFVAGLIIIHLGRKFFKEISFPLLFLITMIPLPENIYSTLANYIRDITFEGASWVISLFGIPFLKEGLLIHLPDIALKVNRGCSGIRYLISYFVFGVAYAYLYRRTTWSRLIIISLTIPISLAASICRLTAIILLTYVFGPHMAEHWPHVLTSWSVFFTVLILSIMTDQFFQTRKQRTEDRRQKADDSRQKTVGRTKNQAPSTQYPAPSTKNPAPSTQYPEDRGPALQGLEDRFAQGSRQKNGKIPISFRKA